ncbi:hypothetical protein FORC55_2950 [Vibrio cholerae]|nr:hypothetical protein FORC55_2950 [Vibrio cholerae]
MRKPCTVESPALKLAKGELSQRLAFYRYFVVTITITQPTAGQSRILRWLGYY